MIRQLAWSVGSLIALLGTLPSGAGDAAVARPGEYLIHVWRAEDGLPQNSVNCLAQTPDGYLWIGTRSGGLARFDGHRFVTFNPQTTPELRDVEFETLSVDSRGTLWITAGNESVAALTAGRFRLVRDRNAQPRWHPLRVVAETDTDVFQIAYATALFRVPRAGVVNEMTRLDLTPPPPTPFGDFHQDARGDVWYLAQSQVAVRVQLETTNSHRTAEFPLAAPADALGRDSSGRIWVAAGNQLSVMTPTGFSDGTPTNGPPLRQVRRLVAGQEDRLWVWDANGLRRLHQGEWDLTVPDFSPRMAAGQLRFYADSRGGLWVVEYGVGLWHITAEGRAQRLTSELGLPSSFITSWLEDREGNIWLGTKEAGLVRIRRSWFRQYSTAQGIPGDVVQSVCEDRDGNIWVGTATGGLARKVGDRFESVGLPPVAGVAVESVTVYPAAPGGIWIGAVKGGVWRYAAGKLTRPFPVQVLQNRMVDVVLEGDSGRVWLGNGSGAYFWDNNHFQRFGRENGFVENVGVRALAEGPPGCIWFGTEPGDVWQYAAGQITRHSPPADWPLARVAALLPETDGALWVGTLGGGLLRLQEGKFSRITTQHGLPDNSITQLLADDEGYLWCGTYAGIARVSRQELLELLAGQRERLTCSVYGQYDGLPSQAYSGWFQPACWRSRDGQLWFTTVNGVVSVAPRTVERNLLPPPVLIEEFRVDGGRRELSIKANSNGATQSGERLRELQIEPGRHYVEVQFTGINFTAPDQVRFRWRLDGAESRWREAVNQRTASYGPLLPGEYAFRVQAANSDGIWNEAGDVLRFTVAPYLWETWWFRAGLGALLLLGCTGGIFLAMRRRHRLQLERIERQHEVERERARIARDLHDDLGTSLTHINLLSGLVSHEHTPSDKIGPLTRQIRSAAREMVNRLNEIVWAVNPKHDRLGELLGYLGNFAESFCRDAQWRCRLKISAEIPDQPIRAELRHNLYLAFKEAVNNAIRHSGGNELRIHATVAQDQLRVVVADNGNGLGAATPERRGGHGLSNMRQRLERLGGDCTVQFSPQGSIIEFRLPLS